eukprot:2353718-Rhodomonas_salina.4
MKEVSGKSTPSPEDRCLNRTDSALSSVSESPLSQSPTDPFPKTFKARSRPFKFQRVAFETKLEPFPPARANGTLVSLPSSLEANPMTPIVCNRRYHLPFNNAFSPFPLPAVPSRPPGRRKPNMSAPHSS